MIVIGMSGLIYGEKSQMLIIPLSLELIGLKALYTYIIVSNKLHSYLILWDTKESYI